ncbi:MAG: hypothetical protein ACO2ON_00390 [Candidatus Nanopusillus sp.]
MGLLQAARYYILNGDINKAKSFGSDRAILYFSSNYGIDNLYKVFFKIL